MKYIYVSYDNQWKELADRNPSFHSLLTCLIKNEKIGKDRLPVCLNLEAKYELIRMESLEMLQFNEGHLKLENNTKALFDFYTEKYLGIAG